MTMPDRQPEHRLSPTATSPSIVPVSGEHADAGTGQASVWLTLVLPVVFTASVLAVIWAVCGPERVRHILVMTAASLWLFGRFVILGGRDPDVAQVSAELSSAELFWMVFYLDVMIALIMAFHLPLLYRIPLIGRQVQSLVTDGSFILSAHPWIRRATFLGLVCFVAFPLSATGSVGGTIFGRLLGLGRLVTFSGILIGSLIGDGLFLFAADLIGSYVDKDHPTVKFGGLAIVTLLVVLMEWKYRRMKQRFAQRSAVVCSVESVSQV